jgi:hypothetical protein
MIAGNNLREALEKGGAVAQKWRTYGRVITKLHVLAG